METTQAHQDINNAIQAGNVNVMIEATAGSGKTTTICRALDLIPASKKVVFLAFNKRIAEELQTRVPAHVKAQTTHSLGMGSYLSWARQQGLDTKQLKVDTGKVRAHARAIIASHESHAVPCVCRLVSLAKAEGVAPITTESVQAVVEDSPEVWAGLIEHHDLEMPSRDGQTMPVERVVHLARQVLARSYAERNVIDFDDMLYMPVLLGAKVTRYDWVFVDEAQDLSSLQHELVARASQGGRVVAVGDPAQAIYGFRGANSASMEALRQRFNMVSLPLHVSYRCPQAVVAEAQRYVGHIQPHASAPVGTVDDREQELADADVNVGDFVLCRFNAPLVQARLDYLHRGIPAVLLGNDLATALIALIKKLAAGSMKELAQRLTTWEQLEVGKALAKGDEGKVVAVQDKAESLRLFMGGADSLVDLENLIRTSFSDDPGARVTLSSIHRSKGLEADRVFLVNFGVTPKFATKPWMLTQERNLCYVGITRAKSHLAYVVVPRPQDKRAAF